MLDTNSCLFRTFIVISLVVACRVPDFWYSGVEQEPIQVHLLYYSACK